MASKEGREPAKVVERLTIGLLPRVAQELRDLTTESGMSKADVINRAVRLYAYVDCRSADGDELFIRSKATGEIERITLI